MKVDIVGEDQVTTTIIERLINEYRNDIEIDKRLPARGGQIKNLAPKYNLLQTPIILLTDLDQYDCPPSLIRDWFGNSVLNPNYLFRVAHEEAESWLMADREGFANWIGVNINLIPQTRIINEKKGINEVIFNFKPSLFMMIEIASKSKYSNIRENLTPKIGAKKGPLYNAALIPFITNIWNIENAASNSYSLSKAIQRLVRF